LSQLTNPVGICKRKASLSEAKKHPPDHYEYEREKTPFPEGFGEDDLKYQLQ